MFAQIKGENNLYCS